MMISTKGRYALRIMIDLAQHNNNQFLSLNDVAQRQNISVKYLESIVATLYKAGFLESLRGKKGGYRLKYEPSYYTIGAILQTAEGTLAPVTCLDKTKNFVCDRSSNCLTLPLWQKLDDVVNDYLESITLADLINCTV